MSVVILAMFLILITPAESLGERGITAFIGELRSGIGHIGQRERSGGPNIKVEKWLGTGFLVDQRCTFATAKHVFAKADKERIVIRYEIAHEPSKVGTAPARIIYEDPKTDLAFLHIDYIDGNPCRTGRHHSFQLVNKIERGSLVGEAVLIIGHPILARFEETDLPVVRRGTIASSEIHWNRHLMLLLDLLGVPGFSGSPVILVRTGEAIGVVYGPGPTPRIFGFEWATPITYRDYEKAIKQATIPDSPRQTK
jgi:S1-C subfamily serine protease